MNRICNVCIVMHCKLILYEDMKFELIKKKSHIATEKNEPLISLELIKINLSAYKYTCNLKPIIVVMF